jgi:hypothetical protein
MIEQAQPATRSRPDRSGIYHNQILTSIEFTRDPEPLHGMAHGRPLSEKCSLCYSVTRGKSEHGDKGGNGDEETGKNGVVLGTPDHGEF